MPGTPLPRRFYDVLSKSVYSLVAWMVLLLGSLQMEAGSEEFKQAPQYSVTFFLLTFPLYCLVMFGCYAMCAIGYHMIVLEDCKDAQDEILAEVQEARKFLTTKGMKF